MKKWMNLRLAMIGMVLLMCLPLCACSSNGKNLSFQMHMSIQPGGTYELSDTTCSVSGEGSFEGSDLEIPSSHIFRDEAVEFLKLGVERVFRDHDIQYLTKNWSDITNLYSTERTVTKIDRFAFSECVQLESVVIPDTVTEIGAEAFAQCTNLKKIVMSENIALVEPGAFTGCPEELFTEYEGALYIGNEENPYLVLAKIRTDVTSVQVHENTKVIACEAFRKGKALTDLSIPNASIMIPEDELASCTSLQNVKLPIAKGLEYVLNDDAASYSVSGLGSCEQKYFSVPIEHEGLPVTGIADNAFFVDSEHYESLAKQYKRFIKNCKSEGYTDMEKMKELYIAECGTEYFDLQKIVEIEMISLHAGIASVGRNTFHGNIIVCVSPENSTYRIEDECWIYSPDNTLICANGTYIDVPDEVRAIGEQAFSNPDIKEITLPGSVTSIGKNAFQDCCNMTSLTVMGNVTVMDGIEEAGVFESCSSLNSILYAGTREEWESVFPNGIPDLGKTFVYFDYTTSDGYEQYDGDSEIALYYNFALEEE